MARARVCMRGRVYSLYFPTEWAITTITFQIYIPIWFLTNHLAQTHTMVNSTYVLESIFYKQLNIAAIIRVSLSELYPPNVHGHRRKHSSRWDNFHAKCMNSKTTCLSCSIHQLPDIPELVCNFTWFWQMYQITALKKSDDIQMNVNKIQ